MDRAVGLDRAFVRRSQSNWLAIKKAVDEGFKRIILEGDALNVIEPLKNKVVVSH